MLKALKFIFPLLLIRTIVLFIIIYLAIQFVPLQKNFLGGGISRYLENPYLWSWANFDGEHFLSIARTGYKPLQYFFFPIYPLTVRLAASLFDNSILNYLWSGLFVSSVFFLISIVGLYKLIREEFGAEITRLTVLLFLVFPTSFYFHAVYSESLFLALSVWSFYFMSKKNWVIAGILVGFASATRVVGLALTTALIFEMLVAKEGLSNLFKKSIGILFSAFGIVSYLYFLWVRTGDPLEFLHSVEIYGEQRSSHFTLLPQVFYRYIFKIIPNVNYSYFPAVFATWMEFIMGLMFLALIIYGILGKVGKLHKFRELKKIKWSYLLYSLLSYIIPTLSGSFSSFPRYVLIIFPSFIIAGIFINKISLLARWITFCLLFIGLVISTALFARGYWVS